MVFREITTRDIPALFDVRTSVRENIHTREGLYQDGITEETVAEVISVSWEDFDSAISFRHFGSYLPDATIFSELSKAIRNEEVVEFGYKKLDAKAYEKRTVEPWHLACVSGQWYLLAHDRTRKARRIFVLARIRRVSITGQKFSNPRPASEEIQRLFRNSFQIWQNENATLEQIVLRLSGRTAQLVRERNWHSSQQIQELADGNLELSLTLNSLEEIVPGFFPGEKIVKWLVLRNFEGRLGRGLSEEGHRLYLGADRLRSDFLIIT